MKEKERNKERERDETKNDRPLDQSGTITGDGPQRKYFVEEGNVEEEEKKNEEADENPMTTPFLSLFFVPRTFQNLFVVLEQQQKKTHRTTRRTAPKVQGRHFVFFSIRFVVVVVVVVVVVSKRNSRVRTRDDTVESWSPETIDSGTFWNTVDDYFSFRFWFRPQKKFPPPKKKPKTKRERGSAPKKKFNKRTSFWNSVDGLLKNVDLKQPKKKLASYWMIQSAIEKKRTSSNNNNNNNNNINNKERKN